MRSSARVRAYDRRVRRGFSRALLFFLHIRPAELADSRGRRSIHGRLLTAWSTAGVLGP